MLPLKIAVVTPKNIHGEEGDAEHLYAGLVAALNRKGHIAHKIEVLIDEATFEGIFEAYCCCFYLNLDEYDIIITTKSPTYMVKHRNHISYLPNTIKRESNNADEEILSKWRIIQIFDKYGLDPVRIKKHFVTGNTVFERMIEADPFWRSIPFEILHYPPKLENFSDPNDGEFILFPSGIHAETRPDLIIKAMEYVKTDVRLVICGSGEYEDYCHFLAKDNDRIIFLGHVDNDTLLYLYSRSIVVAFVPINEDYGLITIEAFMSRKPVITCIDSGEPVHIVQDGVSGFILEPDPKKIAGKIDYLVRNPCDAAHMGENGYQSIRSISWDMVVTKLLSNLEITTKKCVKSPLNVLVMDLTPIEPTTGGGPLRIKGLYSHLGENIHSWYIGPNWDSGMRKYREVTISESFKEFDIPLHKEYFKLNDYFNKLLPGRPLNDLLFPFLGEASQEYIKVVQENTEKADVVIFSHPWVYPLIKTQINLSNKIIIYDSHNCEGLLQEHLLGNTAFAKCLANFVKFVERELCEESDLILACSDEDKLQFARIYNINPCKVEVFPNGVDINDIFPETIENKKKIRSELQLPDRVAIFVGSEYLPNVEAGQFIVDSLADECPNVTFLIVGGVGNKLNAKKKRNVKIVGVVSDEKKRKLLAASDIAINPMFHGSGTNVKMFDFLAAGLPTISSPIGARGILDGGDFIIAEPAKFSDEIQKIFSNPVLFGRLRIQGRSLVEHHYSWITISKNLGERILSLKKAKIPEVMQVKADQQIRDGYWRTS